MLLVTDFVRCRFAMTANVLRLGVVADFLAQKFNRRKMLNYAQISNRSRSAPLLALPC